MMGRLGCGGGESGLRREMLCCAVLCCALWSRELVVGVGWIALTNTWTTSAQAYLSLPSTFHPVFLQPIHEHPCPLPVLLLRWIRISTVCADHHISRSIPYTTTFIHPLNPAHHNTPHYIYAGHSRKAKLHPRETTAW